MNMLSEYTETIFYAKDLSEYSESFLYDFSSFEEFELGLEGFTPY